MLCRVISMCEVVSCAETDKAAEFAALSPPDQQCDEPLPPYKIIKPVYDGHFTDTFPRIDAVSRSYQYFIIIVTMIIMITSDISDCCVHSCSR